MPRRRSSISDCTANISIVDGIVRIDEAVARGAADGMPALALTDLANVFGMVKFYKAAREAGVKPIIGCDVWIANEADRDKPYRLLLLCQSRAGYLGLCELLTRAYRENQYRGRAELRREWFAAAGAAGLIALSGAHAGDVGAALLQDNRRQARAAGARVGGALPGPLLPRAAARRCAADGGLRRSARSQLAGRLGPAGGRDAPGAVREAATISGARGARVHRRGLRARRPAPAARVHAGRSTSRRRPRWRQLFADLPAGARQQRRDREALQPRRSSSARSQLPRFPTPAGVSLDEYLAQPPREGPRASASRSSIPTRRARAARAALPRAARVRDRRPSSRWASPATS